MLPPLTPLDQATDPAPAARRPSARPALRPQWRWWLALGLLWILTSAADRLWLQLDQRLPAWDQADYLNSAVDHGRALGLLGGRWQGWSALLDLSPKIPPLASLIHGSVMALAGQAPDQAAWSLVGWHGLLLLVVAAWGRQLLSPGFGLLAAALLCLTPALAALRVDYTLDLAVTASSTLALWLLGRWQRPGPEGGRWGQALAAGAAIGAALLVKQSALLVLLLPGLWAAGQALWRRGRRLQLLMMLTLLLALVLPWLHHNWITTLSGTNRSVIESAAREGDPSGLSAAGLLWYLRLLPAQLGALPVGVALLGAVLGGWQRWRAQKAPGVSWRPWPAGWPWLVGCIAAGWLLTTLSPNKDARYIAPVLPLLVLLLARGWWQLGLGLQARWGAKPAALALAAALASGGADTIAARRAEIEAAPAAPVQAVLESLRQRVGRQPTTLIVLPSTAALNQHNISSFGRLGGGAIVGRQAGKRDTEHPLVLDQARWLLLASGDQGTKDKPSRRLSRKVRRDGRFALVQRWPWSRGRQVELWQRRPDAAPPEPFDGRFIALARGLEQGPAGLARVFDAVGSEHQLDGHLLYQPRVARWAHQRLAARPDDRDALWSLTLLALLQNRPTQASAWLGRLQTLEPANPWPPAYRSVVLLADWNPWQAREMLEQAPGRSSQPLLQGLYDLSVVLSGDLRALGGLRRSLPTAVDAVRVELAPAEAR
ncbi:MAG: glycosyltransferase family 39 protein [Synechococcaceae cyanobacterium]|nr:glycosyltransferase family 39 protein [Synechococcaceae cyanobacterium]